MKKELKPSEIAMKIAELKDEKGSLRKAAEAYGISAASASRYLKILGLPKNQIKLIDEGKEPIRKTKKENRYKPVLSLNEKDNEIIDILARTRFINTEQLSKYSKINVASVRNIINKLESMGLLSKNSEYIPHVFNLNSKGCNLAGINKPKHFISGAAIHQHLMRNQIEISIRNKNNSAHFISRVHCWRMGIFPALGEHCMIYTHNGEEKIALIILDDYAMQTSRILKCLKRLHSKAENKILRKHSTVKHSLTWADIIDSLYVYCTSEKGLESHKAYYQKNKRHYEILKIRPIFRHQPSIWEVH